MLYNYIHIAKLYISVINIFFLFLMLIFMINVCLKNFHSSTSTDRVMVIILTDFVCREMRRSSVIRNE